MLKYYKGIKFIETKKWIKADEDIQGVHVHLT